MAHNDLGALYADKGEKEKVIYHYEQAVKLQPENIAFQKNLAGFYNVKLGSVKDATEEMYQNAQMLIEKGMDNAAIMALGKLLESYPNCALAHNDLGVLYYKAGKKDEALKHYQRAAELQPESINFQKNLADFYYVELGRIKDAMEIYVKILSLNPKDIECLLMLGHICVSMEKFDDAKVFYVKVLEADPDNVDARQNLDALQKYEQDAAM